MPPRPRTEDAPFGRPLFLLNLKSYPPAVGRGAVHLGRLLARAAREVGVSAAIAPAPADVALVASEIDIPVLAQHADPLEAGARTGFLVPSALRAAGARGSLVNHSEHPLNAATVRTTVAALERASLVPVVCAGTALRAASLLRDQVPYLAIEPPELIGGKVSVSTARPELIERTVAAVRRRAPRTLVLCGAGIQNGDDVRTALRLGAEGVLVASAIAAAENPAERLRDMLAGF